MNEHNDGWSPDWSKISPGWIFAGGLGIGALIAGGVVFFAGLVAAALLVGPFLFWLAWNVLDFGVAVGLSELGFWAIVLATIFLVVDWFGKTVIAGIVMLVDPGWFQTEATLRWRSLRARVVGLDGHVHRHPVAVGVDTRVAIVDREIPGELVAAPPAVRAGARPQGLLADQRRFAEALAQGLGARVDERTGRSQGLAQVA